MIWLTWRQMRTSVASTTVILIGLGVLLLITGISLDHLFYTSGLNRCAANGGCGSAANTLFNDDTILQNARQIVLLVPALVGIFWGAPLFAREIENGTHRMVWTQSVTRTRWLATKLIVVGTAGIIATEAVTLMESWWFRPLDRINQNRFTSTFSEAGIVPIGYAAFAFVLGVTAGLVIHRTLPAMAVTLVGFTAARVAVTNWVRPHLLTPVGLSRSLAHSAMSFGSTNGGPFTLTPQPPTIPNAWIYSTHIVDQAGHPIAAAQVAKICPALASIQPPGLAGGAAHVARVPGDVQAKLHECVAALGAAHHALVTYQPASRYWPFQWYETGIFVAGALALAGLCFWLVRRTGS